MEKINYVEKTEVVTMHEFYCDECGCLLGSSEEWDDGYYEEIGEVSWSFGNFEKNGHYCDKCKEKVWNKLKKTLKGLGFEEGDEG